MVKTIEIRKAQGVSESQAYALRLFVNEAAPNMTAAELNEVADMIEPWEANTPYKVDDVRTEDADVFRCIQAHTSQMGWEPSATPALWEKQAGANADGIPVWIRKYDGVGYMKGDQVCYPDANGEVYESDENNNVQKPDVYGWHKATVNSENIKLVKDRTTQV